MARELKTSTSDWFCSKLTQNITDAGNLVGILCDLFWVHSQPSQGEFLRIFANHLGFEKFKESKVETTDDCEYGMDEDVRVYRYINCLAIAINDGQFGGEGKYYLLLDRSEWQTDDLEELELRLFCWAMTEGYFVSTS